MIALYRHTPWGDSCWLRSQAQVEELLALAQQGDSLHNVTDAISANPVEILQTVREQRGRGEGKQL